MGYPRTPFQRSLAQASEKVLHAARVTFLVSGAVLVGSVAALAFGDSGEGLGSGGLVGAVAALFVMVLGAAVVVALVGVVLSIGARLRPVALPLKLALMFAGVAGMVVAAVVATRVVAAQGLLDWMHDFF